VKLLELAIAGVRALQDALGTWPRPVRQLRKLERALVDLEDREIADLLERATEPAAPEVRRTLAAPIEFEMIDDLFDREVGDDLVALEVEPKRKQEERP
jgi:hypothetical protein